MSRDILSEDEEIEFRSKLSHKYTNPVVVGVSSVDVLHEQKLDQFGIYIVKCVQEILQKYKVETLYWERGNQFFIVEIFSSAELQRKLKLLRSELNDLNNILENQLGNTVSIAFSNTGRLRDVSLFFRRMRGNSSEMNVLWQEELSCFRYRKTGRQNCSESYRYRKT